MENEFKEYLQGFLKRYQICDDSVNFDMVNDCEALLDQLGPQNFCEIIDIPTALRLIFDLHQKGIYLYRSDYQSAEAYAAQKDQWIDDKRAGIFSVENYIERFLLDKYSLIDLYEHKSIYAMGNPYMLDREECKLASIFMGKLGIPNVEIDTNDITDRIQNASPDLVQALKRPTVVSFPDGLKLDMREGGLLRRLRFFNFHIEGFLCKTLYKIQICKIIFFFDQLEHTPIITNMLGKKSKRRDRSNTPYFNVIDFLSQPSMENTGYVLSKQNRFNGKITDFIKNQLEKELGLKKASIREMNTIRMQFQYIADVWNRLFQSAYNAIDTDQEFDFGQINRLLRSSHPIIPTYKDLEAYNFKNDKGPEPNVPISENPYRASPIVAFYFKVLQFEYLGEILDRQKISSIKIRSNYNVTQEFVNRMRLYREQFVEGDVCTYILENIDSISECVYLKSKVTSAEKQKIRYRAKNISSILEHCEFEWRAIKSPNGISKLLVISCLQAIILDEKSDEEYEFYNYQCHLDTTHKPRLSITHKPPKFYAQRLYWARQIEEHWYANLGKYERLCQLREFEKYFYQLLNELYSSQDLDEMLDDNQNYWDEISRIIG